MRSNTEAKPLQTVTHSKLKPTPSKSRPIYPFSVIPGGAYEKETVTLTVASDSLVAKHYSSIRLNRLEPIVLDRPRLAYVSYRRNGNIFWTAKPVTLKKGEVVLTDGKQQIRGRCGNRISETPQFPVEKPAVAVKEEELDKAIAQVSEKTAETLLEYSTPVTVTTQPPATTDNKPPVTVDIVTPLWPTQISSGNTPIPTPIPPMPPTPPGPQPITPPEGPPPEVTPPPVIPPPVTPPGPPVTPPGPPETPPGPPVTPPGPPVTPPGPPETPPGPPVTPPGPPETPPGPPETPPGPPETPPGPPEKPPCCDVPPDTPPPPGIPEPGTFVMLGVGLAGALVLRRHQSSLKRR